MAAWWAGGTESSQLVGMEGSWGFCFVLSYSDVESRVEKGDGRGLTSPESGAELGLTMGLLASAQVPCYLHHT